LSQPWRTGVLRLRFEPGATRTSVGAELRAHRVVWGVLGVADAAAEGDTPGALAPLRDAFCRAAAAYPRAVAASCLAVGATDAQARGLGPPPPGDDATRRFVVLPTPSALGSDDALAALLAPHVAAVLYDFGATLLMALERRCASLASSPAAALSLGSGAWDSPGVDAAASARPGRALKAAADVCLLAGSPRDAAQRYAAALEELTAEGDALWAAAAEVGTAAAALLTPASEGALPPLREAAGAAPDVAARVAARLAHAADAYAAFGASGAPGRAAAGALALEARLQLARLHACRGERAAAAAALELALAGAADSGSGSGSGGGGGSGGGSGSSGSSRPADAPPAVPLTPAERASLLAAAADVAGALGHVRRRGLLLWRAARLAEGACGPEGPALAFRLLSSTLPPTHAAAAAASAARSPSPASSASSSSSSSKPHPLTHWRALQRGVLWGCLTAATRGADAPAAWDVAARLLREHAPALSPPMQAGLVRALEAAAALLPAEGGREEHPPPAAALLAVRPPPPWRRPSAEPQRIAGADAADAAGAAPGGEGGSGGVPARRAAVFVFSPFERARAAAAAARAAAAHAATWVAGEEAELEVALSNPCAVPLRVDGLSLVAAPGGAGLEASACTSAAGGAGLLLEPHARGVRALLRATPAGPGALRLVGVRVEAFGVAWVVPWTPRAQPRRGASRAPGRATSAAAAQPSPAAAAAAACFEVRVLPPLPLLTAKLAGVPPPAQRLTPAAAAVAAAQLPMTPPVPMTPPAPPAASEAPASPATSPHASPPASPLRPRRVSASSSAAAAAASTPPATPTATPSRRAHGGTSRVKRSRSVLFFGAAAGGGGSSAAAAAHAPRPPLALTLLEGQRLELLLKLRNVGPVRAIRALLDVDVVASASASHAAAASPRVRVDADALAAAPPVPPGGRVVVPVCVTAAAAMDASAVDVAAAAAAGLEAPPRPHREFLLRCTYSEGSDGAAGGEGHSREAVATLHVATAPGLRVQRAALRPLLRGAAASSPAPAAGALISLTLLNAAACELRVAVDAAPVSADADAESDGRSAAAADVSASAMLWEAVPPGGTLSLLLPASPLPPGVRAGCAAAAAAALAAQARVRWRGPGGAAGALHGLQHALEAALQCDADALAALAPRTLQLSAAIAPLQSADASAADTDAAAATTDADGCVALRAGQLARLTLALCNAGAAAAPLSMSVAVYASDGACCAGGSSGSAGQRGAVMWAGSLASAPAEALPGGSVTHDVTLLFLLRGRYTLVVEGRAAAGDVGGDAGAAGPAVAQAALHVRVMEPDDGQ
jgi:hypothetical protein